MSRPKFKFVGKPIKAIDQLKFLYGRGLFIDDFRIPSTLPPMLHVALVTSPHAHARIKSIDVSEAEKMPGVFAVYTGRDLVPHHKAPLPINTPAVPRPHQYILAVEKVRHYGEPVAVVLAEDLKTAKIAATKVKVEYEVLPAVVDPEEAIKDGAPLLHEGVKNNIAYHDVFVYGDVDKAFAEADVVYKDRFYYHRSTSNPVEPLGAISYYDKLTGEMHCWSNWQNPRYLAGLAAAVLGIPPAKYHAYRLDSGGSFGAKYAVMYTAILTGMLSILTGRPVKYFETRGEYLASWHSGGEERIYYVEAAAKRDGTILALKEKIISDYGAYMGVYSPGQEFNPFAQWTGAYKIKNVYIEITCVLTNKTPTSSAQRGFGAPQQAFIVERVVDGLAEMLGIDRVEIRRKNFIQPHEFPYVLPTGNIYDSGDYPTVLEKALKLSKFEELKKKQEELRKKGRYIGIGLAAVPHRSSYNIIEMAVPNPAVELNVSPAAISLRVNDVGQVVVTVYFAQSGQSHRTDVAQMVADALGIDMNDVNVVIEDDVLCSSYDAEPGGSRQTPMMDLLVGEATKRLKEKMIRMASVILGWDIEHLVYEDGWVKARNNPEKKISFKELAFIANWQKFKIPMEDVGLEVHVVLNSPSSRVDPQRRFYFYPFMGFTVDIPVVEVDIETGTVKLLKYYQVHDSGTIINPLVARGQVIGGLVHGMNDAYLGEIMYDNKDGKLLSTNFGTCFFPTSKEIPEFIIEFHETPSPINMFGAKGLGESGRISAPAAIASAIEDALKPFGIKIKEVPVIPDRLISELIKRKG